MLSLFSSYMSALTVLAALYRFHEKPDGMLLFIAAVWGFNAVALFMEYRRRKRWTRDL
jgi:hypothetical protein